MNFTKCLQVANAQSPVRALNKGTDLLDVPSPVIRPDRPGRDDRTSTRHQRAEDDELLKQDKVKLDIFWLEDDTLEDSADFPDPDVLVKICERSAKLIACRCSYDRFDIPTMIARKQSNRAGAGHG